MVSRVPNTINPFFHVAFVAAGPKAASRAIKIFQISFFSDSKFSQKSIIKS